MVFLALFVGLPCVAGTSMRLNANPIRRVVTMLQMMQSKIESEGKTEQDLYDKFMCYCKSGVGGLVTSIQNAEQKIAQLESSIEETDSATKQLVGDTAKAKADRSEAVATLGKAKAIRGKEQRAFQKLSADAKANIAAMSGATAAIGHGAAAAFLQTRAASQLKRLSIVMDISESDRQVLSSFLSTDDTDESEEYAPAGGEIAGILKQMQETMTASLAEAVQSEKERASDYNALTGAKQRQIGTLTKEIESKMVRSGEAGVDLTNQKEDLTDTSKSLVSDKKFLIEVTRNCQTKKAEKEVNDKMRADEMLALADTIKILNDDDSLDLFKKTLPGSSSFLQVSFSSKALKKRALQALSKKHHGKHDFRLNLITLALRGKKANFVKVVKMVDDMAALLKKEQASDSRKKAYCEKNVDETEDEFKELQQDVKDLDKAIADHKENIKSMSAELESLTKGIVDLDKEVAAATKNRRDDNTEYKQSMSSDLAATELLDMAKNRLAKFYSPKLAKAALLEEERTSPSIAGATPTAAPAGVTAAFAQYEDEVQDEASIGFLQVRSGSRRAARAAPPPPPESAGAYKKSGEQSNGVMAMLDILINDLKKGVTENETNEKLAQKEYEEFIEDAADKRAGNARSISDKEGNKVELEANSLKLQGDRKGKMAESMAKMEAIQGLHSECDWLVKNYDVRKQARASEIENLSSAKAVLSGADS